MLHWDPNRGRRWDLGRPNAQRRIRGWIAQGLVEALVVPPSMAGLARLRVERDGRAQAARVPLLRSTAAPWGSQLAHGSHEAQLVDVGNSSARFVSSVIDACPIHQVVACVLHPASSFLWDSPPLVGRTAFAWPAWGFDPEPLKRLYLGRNLCTSSHAPHQNLLGCDSRGVPWRRISKRLPGALAEEMMRALRSGVGVTSTRRLALCMDGGHCAPTHPP